MSIEETQKMSAVEAQTLDFIDFYHRERLHGFFIFSAAAGGYKKAKKGLFKDFSVFV